MEGYHIFLRELWRKYQEISDKIVFITRNLGLIVLKTLKIWDVTTMEVSRLGRSYYITQRLGRNKKLARREYTKEKEETIDFIINKSSFQINY